MMHNVKKMCEDLGDARKRKAEIKQRRDAMLNEVETLKVKDNFTKTDQKLFDEKVAEIEAENRELALASKEVDKYTDDLLEAGEDPYWHLNDDHMDFLPGQNKPAAAKSKWVDPKTGKEVRVLGQNENLYNQRSGFDDFDMAKAIRALATGDYSGAKNEIRAMDLSGTAAMVPTPVSQRLIDRARDMMVLNSLGMKTVPMDSSTLTFARVDPDGDPTPEWKAENAAFSNSDVGISGVQLSAKTVICGVSLSHELAADSPNASQVVEDTIAKAIANEIDRAGLLGSGTAPEPQGIFGHAGVTDTALAAAPTYDDFSNLFYRLANSNEKPNGLITSSRTMQTLDQLKDSQGRYLDPPQSWEQFQKMSTNAIPNDEGDGSDESLAIMGNFEQLFQGIRENLQIEVSRQASNSNENAWQELKVFIRVFSRIDFALGRPGAFQTLSGITPA